GYRLPVSEVLVPGCRGLISGLGFSDLHNNSLALWLGALYLSLRRFDCGPVAGSTRANAPCPCASAPRPCASAPRSCANAPRPCARFAVHPKIPPSGQLKIPPSWSNNEGGVRARTGRIRDARRGAKGHRGGGTDWSWDSGSDTRDAVAREVEEGDRAGVGSEH